MALVSSGELNSGKLNSEKLNNEQSRAVAAPLGPTLVLAGPGSGKTRVLAFRAKHLVEKEAVLPREIVALTFTNKAAHEMRSRLHRLGKGGGPFIGTFHAFALLLLRRYGVRIGLPTPFGILAGKDQSDLLREAASGLGLKVSAAEARRLLAAISKTKTGLGAVFPIGIDGEALLAAYQQAARRMGMVDFDDMLILTKRLLADDREAGRLVKGRYPHLLVDEVQDTNRLQYEIIRLLEPPDEPFDARSLFLVGDADQSIYAFRGAMPENIDRFRRDYKDAAVYRLKTNYRSRAEILRVAGALLGGRDLMANQGSGGLVEIAVHQTGGDEARYVADQAAAAVGTVAVLYRTNAQSRPVEEVLAVRGIPYRLVGANRFYDRREVRDLVSYLSAVLIPTDEQALCRALCAPPRGIGKARLEGLKRFGSDLRLPLIEALPGYIEALPKGSVRRAFMQFADLLTAVKAEAPDPATMLKTVLDLSGYRDWLSRDEAREERLANIDTLLDAAMEPGTEVLEFIGRLRLESSADAASAENGVTLLTLHAAKGLEFDTVILVGFEDDLLPHVGSHESRSGLMEERRLCYVGMTRAASRLVLSRARRRMVRGKTVFCRPSRFLAELPDDLFAQEESDHPIPASFRFERELSFFGGRGQAVRERSAEADLPERPPVVDRQENRSGRFEPGCLVRHPRFGVGTILRKEGSGELARLTVSFLNGRGRKRLIAKYAGLMLIKETDAR